MWVTYLLRIRKPEDQTSAPKTVKTEIYHRFTQPLKQTYSTETRIIPRQCSFHSIAQQCELLTLLSNLSPKTVKTEVYHRFTQPLKQKCSTTSRIIPRQCSFHSIAQQCELLTVLSNKLCLFTGKNLLPNKSLTKLQRYEQTCP
jgi:hypothetical protein